MATKNIKPFTSLMAALSVFDANDLCGDLDMLDDLSEDEAALIETATDALRTAESVETMSDFVANLQEAVAALSSVADAAQVSVVIQRFLTRCE